MSQPPPGTSLLQLGYVIAGVDVCLFAQQQLYHFEVCVFHDKHERCPTILRLTGHTGLRGKDMIRTFTKHPNKAPQIPLLINLYVDYKR